jgi:hypothetical protein
MTLSQPDAKSADCVSTTESMPDFIEAFRWLLRDFTFAFIGTLWISRRLSAHANEGVICSGKGKFGTELHLRGPDEGATRRCGERRHFDLG